MMSYRNPFSAGNAPKIPDGKCVQSLGLKKNATIPYDFQAEQTRVDIVLIPGLNKPLFMVGKKADGTYLPLEQKGFANPVTRHTLTGFDATTFVPANNATSVQKTDHEIAKWRLVSGGLKIQSLTDCDDDGAWFEAFRFSPQFGENFQLQGDAATDTLWTGPKATLFGNTTIDSLSEKGNYFSGKLNQLGRFPMKLNEVNANHNFIDMGDTFALGISGIDSNMDCLYIRIHGKPAPATAGTSCCSGTKLLFNLVMNYELVLAEENVMHKLQTRTQKWNKAYHMYRGNFFPYYNTSVRQVRTRTAGRRKMGGAGTTGGGGGAGGGGRGVRRVMYVVSPSPPRRTRPRVS
nr:capsid protein [Cressdnaviricota sp.]